MNSRPIGLASDSSELRRHCTATRQRLISFLASFCVVASAPLGVALAQDASSTAHPELWPARSATTDAALEKRVDALLARMTLEAKVGQLIQADIGSVTPDDVRKYRLGSILAGGNSDPGGDVRAPPRAWLALADAFYAASMDAPKNEVAIPILWGVDAVHGHNNLVGATLFPHNIGLGAARDPALIRRIGAATAAELAATGIEWTFAPTLAVARDDRWGRTYESYSEDPAIVRAYSSEMVRGLQGADRVRNDMLKRGGILATAKHFLGDGGTQDGRDQGDSLVTESDLIGLHAVGYVPALDAGAQTVMASLSSWHGLKIHGNRSLLTGVLKERMGFDGFVVGDWNGHAQIPGCSKVSCPAAINAGIDMFMVPDDWRALYASTLEQARSGEIPKTRLDDAVRRILRVKLRAGLFEAGKPSSRSAAGRFERLGQASHRALAREAVRRSLVLLKNDGNLLPLRPSAKVLVAGTGADDVSQQSGGWTITWQGTGLTPADFPGAQSIGAGIRAAVERAGGSAEIVASGSFTRKPDVAVVVFGETPYAEFQGDVASVAYRPGESADLELLQSLERQGIPVVAVFLTGRPLYVNPLINASDAFVVAWLPGSEGGGVADVLFRDRDGSIVHDFHGKLAFSWPARPDQTPLNVGDGQTAQFPFGFGLTYSSRVTTPRLPEVTVPRVAMTIEAREFFARGRVGRGWHTVVRDPAGQSTLLPTHRGTAPDGSMAVTAVDRDAQEDALRVEWRAGGGAFAIDSDASVDLSRESPEAALVLELRQSKAPSARVEWVLECGPGCRASVPIDGVLARSPPQIWQRIVVPLRCFAQQSIDTTRVRAPAVLSSAGPWSADFSRIALVEIANTNVACPS